MVSPVIHHMQQDLPQRVLVRIALQICVRNLRQNILVSERGGLLLPALLQSRPLFLKKVELPVFIIDKSWRRISLDPAQPDPVSRKSMRQGAGHALVRSFEIAAEFFFSKF